MKWNSVTTDKHRVLRYVLEATPLQREQGMRWYQDAHNWAHGIARYYGAEHRQVCGVTAALSPGCPWERNLVDAEAVFRMGRHSFTTYPDNVRKARSIRRYSTKDPLDVLGGRKVRSFYALILDPTNGHDVCIDRHAARVATPYEFAEEGHVARWLRTQYDNAAQTYRDVADALGLLPHQVQAICWLHYRAKKGVS